MQKLLFDVRDAVRGFYFDLSVDPPGPLSTTTEELVRHVRELPRIREDHRSAYGRFRQKFCPLDDGRATDRFVARFFGGG